MMGIVIPFEPPTQATGTGNSNPGRTGDGLVLVTWCHQLITEGCGHAIMRSSRQTGNLWLLPGLPTMSLDLTLFRGSLTTAL